MTGFGGLLTGHTLASRYRIGQVIGRGGFAVVYDAHDERLDRAVAVKVITIAGADGTMDEEIRARFQREARSSAGLQHRNVVNVFDFGTDPGLGLDFLVMERLRGEDLRSRLRGSSPVGLPEAMHILSGAAAGVAAGHQAGIIHRDVKPGNIFLTETPELPFYRVCVVDFGIALLVAADDTTRLTRNGIPLSVPYASPEQLAGNVELTPASDVFGLGAVGYEILGGRRPFSGEIVRAQEERLATLRPLRELNADVPESVAAAIHTALNPRPEDRFATAEDFGRALGTLERRSGVPAVHIDSSQGSGRTGGSGDAAEDATIPAPPAAGAPLTGPASAAAASHSDAAEPLPTAGALSPEADVSRPAPSAAAHPTMEATHVSATPLGTRPPDGDRDPAVGASESHVEPSAGRSNATAGASHRLEKPDPEMDPGGVAAPSPNDERVRASSTHAPRSRRAAVMAGVAALLIAGVRGGTLLLGDGDDAGDAVVATREEAQETGVPIADPSTFEPGGTTNRESERAAASPPSAAAEAISPQSTAPSTGAGSPPASDPVAAAAPVRPAPATTPDGPATASRPAARPLPSPAGAEFRENLSHSCQSRPSGEAVPCLQQDLAVADAELNEVYQEALGRLGPAERESLRASQRAWLVRYDRVITSYYSTSWGDHSLSEVLPSQIQALRDRTAYLRAVGGGG